MYANHNHKIYFTCFRTLERMKALYIDLTEMHQKCNCYLTPDSPALLFYALFVPMNQLKQVNER